jgi:hypothetical protein
MKVIPIQNYKARDFSKTKLQRLRSPSFGLSELKNRTVCAFDRCFPLLFSHHFANPKRMRVRFSAQHVKVSTYMFEVTGKGKGQKVAGGCGLSICLPS